MDRGAWRAAAHGVAESQTLSMHTHTIGVHIYIKNKIKVSVQVSIRDQLLHCLCSLRNSFIFYYNLTVITS